MSRPRNRPPADPRIDSADTEPDRGSSVAEFAMVSVMLVLLFFGIIQVCLWIYTRNLLTSAAADVARDSGLANASAFDVSTRVAAELGDGLAGGTTSTLRCTRGGTELVSEIRCTVEAPGLVGLLDGLMPDVTVVGHAAREGLS